MPMVGLPGAIHLANRTLLVSLVFHPLVTLQNWSKVSRYMAELEELIESYRAFAATATLSASADRATQRKLLKRTHKIIGPPPDTLAETRPELARCEDLVTE